MSNTKVMFELEREGFVTFYSDVDDSCVEYLKTVSTFEVFFDSKLYEPPPSVVEFEKQMLED
jgi:hypothetical protein